MENKKSKKKIFIAVGLALFMALAIGLTWGFWAAGINSAENSGDVTIGIGTAERTTTQIVLASSQTGGNLIPQDIELTDGDTHEIAITINVVWNAVANQQNPQNLTGVIGNLLVEVDSIMVGTTDITSATGFRYRDTNPTADYRYHTVASLFEVDIVAPSTIVGNCIDGVEVAVTVRMNIPQTEAMYDLVAGQEIVLSIAFTASV